MNSSSTRIAVIGVDIGTTSTKVVAYDTIGRHLDEAEQGYPLDTSQPGQATQDPRVVFDAVFGTLAEVADRSRRAGVQPAGVAFSSAMHSLLALDAAGEPVTPVLTWADSRAVDQAERLRVSDIGKRAPSADRHAGPPHGAGGEAPVVPRAAP